MVYYVLFVLLVLFAVYIDVLISRLRSANTGCRLLNNYYGCVVYADDIVLLAHTLNGMQKMPNTCTEYDVKFNYTKSVAMTISPRFTVCCKPLKLAGRCLQFVDCVK